MPINFIYVFVVGCSLETLEYQMKLLCFFLPVMIVYKLTLTSLGLVNFFLQLINLLQLPFPTVLRRHLDNQSRVSVIISTNDSSPYSCPSS